MIYLQPRYELRLFIENGGHNGLVLIYPRFKDATRAGESYFRTLQDAGERATMQLTDTQAAPGRPLTYRLTAAGQTWEIESRRPMRV